MPVLGIPDSSGGFSIGTSSNIAPSSAVGGVDMSLDDMIKNRRSSGSVRASNKKIVDAKRAIRKASSGDKAIAVGRAKRSAAANARRGITTSAKPTAMQIEREVYRQTRKAPANQSPKTNNNNNNNKNKNKNNDDMNTRGRKSRRVQDLKAKEARKKKEQLAKKKEDQRKKKEAASAPASSVPTWIGGTRRPPSKKAVTAAVSAMTDAGFKVPKGMQMVISFAPAPETDPTKSPAPKGKRAGDNNNNQRTSTGGGRGRGRGGGRGRGRGRRQ